MLYEITYLFPNTNGANVDVWEWMKDSIPHFVIDVTYPCWGLKLNDVVKSDQWKEAHIWHNL